MSSEKVLICGAGVAGSILAYWLAKYDYQVVVIERSRSDQKLGQGVEIEDPALKIVEMMGLLDKLRGLRTGEEGTRLVDPESHTHALFKAGGGFSPTGSLEIMRGDLTEALYHHADQSTNVSYRFETTIRGLTQTHDKAIVELESRRTKTTTTEEYDFVIGADGARSRTREFLMGLPEQLGCFKPVGACVAYFSIPKDDQDWPYSRVCHFKGRRLIWIRPIGKDSKMVTVYLMHLGQNNLALRQANAAGDRQKQKEALADTFSGLGWEMPRVIESMMKAENFYSETLNQVKLQNWTKGRVALVGDSAWAPTPFTGEGNHLAIIGAWVLAQEMSRNRSPVAFEKYETRLRPYVEEAQKIPLGGYMPYVCCPETALGIWLFRKTIGLISLAVRLISRLESSSTVDESSTVDKRQSHRPFDLQIAESEAEEKNRRL